jgi:hypothetical protein
MDANSSDEEKTQASSGKPSMHYRPTQIKQVGANNSRQNRDLEQVNQSNNHPRGLSAMRQYNSPERRFGERRSNEDYQSRVNRDFEQDSNFHFIDD